MEESTHLIALAGLLHDIGKFAVRAGVRGSRIWDAEAAGDFGYLHALLTADFVDRFVPGPWRIPVKNIAGNHHRPLGRSDQILALADHLSAGERADVAGDERAVQPRQLLSIFCSLTVDGKEFPRPDGEFWPLAPLAIDEAVLFPGKVLADTEVWSRYEGMWNDFTREAETLRSAHAEDGDLPTYLEGVLLLLQRYTWCMPSAYYRNRPDVSLYDHVRMTSALAAVLASSGLSETHLARLRTDPRTADVPVALMVGGDLSGIQDFIYTVTSHGAASALRGRSFYLQLLTEAAARMLLHRLALPITNLIYVGGGHFYLLARPDDADKIAAAQADISRLLLQQHRGDLYVAVAHRKLSGPDFFDGRISTIWGALTEALRQAKQRRFAELGQDLGRLFEPQGHGGGEEQQCQVCGAEHPETHERSKRPDEEGVRKCLPCYSYEELGDSLRHARYLILAQIPVVSPEWTAAPGRWEVTLAGLGMRAELVQPLVPRSGASSASQVILALDDEARQGLTPSPRSAVGRRFLVNVTPTIYPDEIAKLRRQNVYDLPAGEGVKPFGVLEAQSCGIQRLGVLRMDVDNLGRLFSDGLKQQATLSRVAALSFAVSLYFEGWVEHLANERNRTDANGERLYSIYSGGDDLFFVGAWDAVVELARDIRSDLTRFAAGHPDVHASAGIVLVGGKYPLYQAAQDAGRAEEQAKSLAWWADDRIHNKDAVSFLGQALPWRQFGLEPCRAGGIGSAHALMHLLTGMETGQGDTGKSAPQALVRKLIGLYEQYEDAGRRRRERGDDRNRDGRPQVLWGQWMWLAEYHLGRMAKQTGNSEVGRLRDRLRADQFRSMEWIGLAARWAEIIMRRPRPEGNNDRFLSR